MTELIRRLVDSDDNCRWENNGWIHEQPLQEIYTCLQCLDDGMRADERARIIKLLEGFDPRTAIGDLLPLLIKDKSKIIRSQILPDNTILIEEIERGSK